MFFAQVGLDAPDNQGPATAEGGVWLEDDVQAGDVSEPFLFAGWDERSVWIHNDGNEEVTYSFEVDENGDGSWSDLYEISVPAHSSNEYVFTIEQAGEWVRVGVDKSTTATVHFTYTDKETRETAPNAIFSGLSSVEEDKSYGGLLYGLGDNRRALGILAGDWNGNSFSETGYYELDGEMNLIRKEDTTTASFIRNKFAIPENVVSVDEASVLIVDDQGRRWRLPKGNDRYTDRI